MLILPLMPPKSLSRAYNAKPGLNRKEKSFIGTRGWAKSK